MKKLQLFFLVSLLTFSSISVSEEVVSSKKNGNVHSVTKTVYAKKNQKHPHRSVSLMPLCTDGNLICVLGNYTFTSNNYDKPIYANLGIMCTSDGGICTNGQYILKTNKVIYQ